MFKICLEYSEFKLSKNIQNSFWTIKYFVVKIDVGFMDGA